MTIEEAKKIIDDLNKRKLIYHFDEDAEDCLRDKVSKTEAKKIQSQVNQIYQANLDWEKFKCPIGYCLHITMTNKPTILQSDFVELYSTIGGAWLEDAYLDPLWDESDPENITYTEEAQDRFNEITDQLDGILRQFLKVEGDNA